MYRAKSDSRGEFVFFLFFTHSLPLLLVKMKPRDLVYVLEVGPPAHESYVMTGTLLPGNRPQSSTPRLQMMTCLARYLIRQGDRK